MTLSHTGDLLSLQPHPKLAHTDTYENTGVHKSACRRFQPKTRKVHARTCRWAAPQERSDLCSTAHRRRCHLSQWNISVPQRELFLSLQRIRLVVWSPWSAVDIEVLCTGLNAVLWYCALSAGWKQQIQISFQKLFSFHEHFKSIALAGMKWIKPQFLVSSVSFLQQAANWPQITQQPTHTWRTEQLRHQTSL